MHAAVKEKHMLQWIMFILSVNHVAPVRQSEFMHAPHFLLTAGLSHQRFLWASDVKPRRCPLRFQLDRSTILCHRFLQPRETAADFSCCRCSLDFLDTCDTIKIDSFFCYCEFLDTYVPEVHFTSRTSQHQQSDTSQTNKHINKKSGWSILMSV
jgi:hypothetical protein